jgi:hypothetical protein
MLKYDYLCLIVFIFGTTSQLFFGQSSAVLWGWTIFALFVSVVVALWIAIRVWFARVGPTVFVSPASVIFINKLLSIMVAIPLTGICYLFYIMIQDLPSFVIPSSVFVLVVLIQFVKWQSLKKI